MSLWMHKDSARMSFCIDLQSQRLQTESRFRWGTYARWCWGSLSRSWIWRRRCSGSLIMRRIVLRMWLCCRWMSCRWCWLIPRRWVIRSWWIRRMGWRWRWVLTLRLLRRSLRIRLWICWSSFHWDISILCPRSLRLKRRSRLRLSSERQGRRSRRYWADLLSWWSCSCLRCIPMIPPYLHLWKKSWTTW